MIAGQPADFGWESLTFIGVSLSQNATSISLLEAHDATSRKCARAARRRRAPNCTRAQSFANNHSLRAIHWRQRRSLLPTARRASARIKSIPSVLRSHDCFVSASFDGRRKCRPPQAKPILPPLLRSGAQNSNGNCEQNCQRRLCKTTAGVAVRPPVRRRHCAKQTTHDAAPIGSVARQELIDKLLTDRDDDTKFRR